MTEKCHLIPCSADENKKIEFNREVINNTHVQKLLGVHIDYKLKFDAHIEVLCKKVGKSFMLCPSYKVHFYNQSTTINEKFYCRNAATVHSPGCFIIERL